VSEFEDKLSSLMNDPKQMEKIASLAKTLMGGDNPGEKAGRAPTSRGSTPEC
jgi:hypothetical protein